ncbi:MAG: nucleotidyltransferase substrate binding protein [Deltaproteobacteria bacterium]|nr:nucleotidyltransferase substrate binding protein [Candidatus Tharpella aukensis]
MDELKSIRWQQRFYNLKRAFAQLQRGLAIEKPSDIEQQGIIQSFEFTFELAWKTLKDYLESQGVACNFPREVIKQSFHYEIIMHGDVWLDMLGKRNLLSHTYDEKAAQEAYRLIKDIYFSKIAALMSRLQGVTDGGAND